MRDIFYTKDRKFYGNELVFRELIDDLQYLRSEGITINIDNKKHKLYFIPTLITRDN